MELGVDCYLFRQESLTLFDLSQKIIKERFHLRSVIGQTVSWDAKKQSQYVESYMMHIPLGPVYMVENSKGTCDILDGLERLTALLNFMSGELRLIGVLPELEGKTFNDMCVRDRHRFWDLRIDLQIADNKFSINALTQIYDRLNR